MTIVNLLIALLIAVLANIFTDIFRKFVKYIWNIISPVLIRNKYYLNGLMLAIGVSLICGVFGALYLADLREISVHTTTEKFLFAFTSGGVLMAGILPTWEGFNNYEFGEEIRMGTMHGSYLIIGIWGWFNIAAHAYSLDIMLLLSVFQ